MITSATSRRLKITAVIVLAAVALALPFCLIPYGFWPVDEPYQILLSKDCTVNPVAFLSSFIIGAWGNVFGDDLATMRAFAAILSTATVAIAGFVLYSHTRRPLLSIAIASVANILLTFNQSQSYIIGWDVVSNFLIVASLAALFATINTSGKKAVYWAGALGCLTAFAVASRLPNVAVVPVIAVLLLVKRKWKETASFLISAIAIAFILIIAIYGDLFNYFASLSDYTSQQISSEHNAHQLLNAAIIAFRRIWPFALAFFCLLAVAVYAEKKNWNVMMWVAFGLIPIAIICQIAWAFNADNQMISDIFAIPVAALILLSLMSKYNENRKEKIWFAVALLCFFVFPNIGSNAFWSKFLSVQILPIVLMPFVLKPMPAARRMLLFVGCTFLIYLPFNKYYCATWLDEGISQCGYPLSMPKMENIYTSENRFRRISDIYEFTKNDDDVLIVGDGWQTFAYSSGKYDKRLVQFFGVINGTLLNDENYVTAIREKIAKEHPKRVIVTDLILCRHSTDTMMNRMLLYSGYIWTDGGSAHVVYEKAVE
ncbi:MAG: hypothetical protein J6Y87_01635 [Muribaculaceae bacterium]|nr:hypothetical protein [Muribaculaceae bacterium]